MKRFVWTFGLIAGGILALTMTLSMVFQDQFGFNGSDKGAIIGYTTMILAFLMVYFGIRTYRDKELGGVIRFGRAFKAGILMTVIASVCYVATWETIFYAAMPDFATKYAAHEIEQSRASGGTPAQIAAKKKEMDAFVVSYHKPLVNISYTFLEVFPVGLLAALISAGLLSRKKSDGTPMVAAVA